MSNPRHFFACAAYRNPDDECICERLAAFVHPDAAVAVARDRARLAAWLRALVSGTVVRPDLFSLDMRAESLVLGELASAIEHREYLK